MALFGVRISCYEHGVTALWVNFTCDRVGSSNDLCKLRIQRRKSGEPTKTLPGEFNVVLRQDAQTYTIHFLDDDVPIAGDWDYVVQVYKQTGSGSLYNLQMSAFHFKR